MNKEPIIISIANFKGGVGKTTSAINIGAAMALKGKKVLLVDLDPQFNLTQSLGISDPQKSVYHSLVKKEKPLILPIKENIYLFPSSLDLSKAEFEMASLFRREYILREILESLDISFDYILIDCPPALGVLTFNSFVACNYIIIPVEAEFLSLKGFSILRDAIQKVGLDVDKVFITKYDNRKVLNRDVFESLKETLGNKLLRTYIRDNVALAEAPTGGIDIFRYDDKCNGALDYRELTNELLDQLN